MTSSVHHITLVEISLFFVSLHEILRCLSNGYLEILNIFIAKYLSHIGGGRYHYLTIPFEGRLNFLNITINVYNLQKTL